MALRRISTPHDLGAAVRDARTAANLTQAELAERAEVSREWLIGLERGTRPRAELTKILGVLAALDQPLRLGYEEQNEAPEGYDEPARDGVPMTTTEVTRRAIEQSWRPSRSGALASSAAAYALANGRAVSSLDIGKMAAILPKPGLSSILPQMGLSSILPKTDLSAILPKTDFSSVFPKRDYSSLMPEPSPAFLHIMRQFSATLHDGDGDGDDGEHDEHDDGTRSSGGGGVDDGGDGDAPDDSGRADGALEVQEGNR